MEYRKTNLIGPAAIAYNDTLELLQEKKDFDENAFFLYHGAPGIGKTSLIKNVILKVTDPASVIYYNGRRVGIDEIRSIRDLIRYKPLFSDYYYIIIDEIDSMSKAAVELFLELSENYNLAVFATSNKHYTDFSLRFQDRFDLFEIKAPGAAEIKDHLVLEYNINNVIAEQIAANCQSVRAAVKDARRAQLKYNKLVKNAVNAA